MLKTTTALAAFTLAPLALAAPAGAAPSPASFVVVHGIPGRDVGPTVDPAFPVDVLVGGKCLLQSLPFGSIAGPFDVPPGTYPIAISAANPLAPCGNAPAISANVALVAGKFSSIVAALSPSGAPTAEVYPVNVTPVGANQQRFVTAHAADAPEVQVNVVSTGGGPAEAAQFNLAPTHEDTTTVPTRSGFAITATLHGGGSIGPFNVTAGNDAVILSYAVGNANTGSLTLLTRVIPSVF